MSPSPAARRHTVAASHAHRLSACAVAIGFAQGWLGCVYHHGSCAQIPGTLPAYAKLIEPQLGNAPVTHGDLATRPRILSLRLAYSCAVEAVATVTYTAGGQLLELHPSLVLEPDGWKVFAVPEFPVQIPLPPPLHGGQRLC